MNFQGIRNSSVDQTGPTVIEASRISSSTSLAMSRKDESKGAFEQTNALVDSFKKGIVLGSQECIQSGTHKERIKRALVSE
jgi:hypothetical protein